MYGAPSAYPGIVGPGGHMAIVVPVGGGKGSQSRTTPLPIPKSVCAAHGNAKPEKTTHR